MRVSDSPIVGATAQELETLPSKTYDPSTFQLSEDDKSPQCAICLSQYSAGEMVRELPCDSRHHFHMTCVDDWLKLNATCPVCRSKIFAARVPSQRQQGDAGSPVVDSDDESPV